MLFKSSTVVGRLVLFLFFLSGLCVSVYGQDIDYRRVSLSVRGGTTFANEGNGFHLTNSRFNVPTETSGIFGMGIQYAITPAWSLEGGYSYTQIRGRSESFETNMNTLSLINIFNLNQILFVNRISNSINPYLTAGLGYDIYRYESPDEAFDDNSMSYKLGVGLAFKASPTIDLFTHYEYNFASNRVDNIIPDQGSNTYKGFGSDVLVNLTGGIRINFGKKGTTHPSWRTVPVEVSRSKYDYLISQEKSANELEQRLAELKKQPEQQDQEHAKQVKTYTEIIDSLKLRANHLEMRLQEVRDSLATMPEDPKILEPSGIAQSIPAGHYVQIFASLELQSAQNVRSQSMGRLSSMLEDVDNQVFIAKRKQFYEILIGVFNDFQKAEDVLDVEIKNHNDAFIITFPRPLSLQEVYKDMRRMSRGLTKLD